MTTAPDLSAAGLSILFDVQGNDGRRYVEYRTEPHAPLPSTPSLPPDSAFEVFATVAAVAGARFAFTLRERLPAATPPGPGQPQGAPATHKMFGVNLEQMIDFGRSRPFNDLVKTAARFNLPGHPGDDKVPVAVGADGWPAADFSVALIRGGCPSMFGTYSLIFQGQATIVPSNGATLSNLVTDATGTTRAQLNYRGPQDALTLTFTGTSGPRRLQVLRPGVTEAQAAQQLFSKEFLALLTTLNPGVIRGMDALEINNTKVVGFADRSTPATPSYSSTARLVAPGMPYEHLIDLCNAVGADLWLNVPVTADAGYRQQLAQLVAGRLRSDLILYTEFGNENWNAGLGSHAPNLAAAQAERAANGFDPNPEIAGWQRTANEAVKVGKLFAAALGPNRVVRPILAGQGPNLDTLEDGLKYLAARVGTPSSLLWGLAVAPYAPLTPDLAADNFNVLLLGGVHVSAFVGLAQQFGLMSCCYESGVDLSGHGAPSADQKDPRMQALMTAYWGAFKGNGPLLHYKVAGETSSMYGLTDDADDLTQPKYQAARAFSASRAVG